MRVPTRSGLVLGLRWLGIEDLGFRFRVQGFGFGLLIVGFGFRVEGRGLGVES